MYSPNDYKNQITLWQWLNSLPDIPWILASNFNMVENQIDKKGGANLEWKGRERIHWDRMKNLKNLFDQHDGLRHLHKSIWYTWCNFQRGSNRIYCRLDRFYLNKNNFSFILDNQASTVVVWSVTLLDHHPIIAHIVTRNNTLAQPSNQEKFLLNTKLLEDQDTLASLSIIRQFNRWDTATRSHIVRWNKMVKRWQCLLKTIGQKRAKYLGHEEIILFDELHNAEDNPYNLDLSHSISQVRDRLRRIRHCKIRGAMVRASTQWLQLGDKGSKFFFNFLKQKQVKERVDKLWVDGNKVVHIDSIKEESYCFYQSLFLLEDTFDS